jgi:hypothetical protein
MWQFLGWHTPRARPWRLAGNDSTARLSSGPIIRRTASLPIAAERSGALRHQLRSDPEGMGHGQMQATGRLKRSGRGGGELQQHQDEINAMVDLGPEQVEGVSR